MSKRSSSSTSLAKFSSSSLNSCASTSTGSSVSSESWGPVEDDRLCCMKIPCPVNPLKRFGDGRKEKRWKNDDDQSDLGENPNCSDFFTNNRFFPLTLLQPLLHSYKCKFNEFYLNALLLLRISSHPVSS